MEPDSQFRLRKHIYCDYVPTLKYGDSIRSILVKSNLITNEDDGVLRWIVGENKASHPVWIHCVDCINKDLVALGAEEGEEVYIDF